MLECVRAWNDFQIDWISVAPERFVANISIPFWDIEASVKEIERVAPKGMRGILFTGDPQSHGEPFLGDHHWDPLWNIATDAGLPISFPHRLRRLHRRLHARAARRRWPRGHLRPHLDRPLHGQTACR